MHKIENLIFSGGGVKVISYVGAIQALEEKGIATVRKVGGTSGGAIVSLCLALGYSAEELIDVMMTIDFKKISDKKANWRKFIYYIFNLGLNSGDYLNKYLKEIVRNKGFDENITFSELQEKGIGKEFYVVVTNLNCQFVEVLSHKTAPDMQVVSAVHMSAAFPVYFKPIEYDKIMYVDGGLVYNYPVDMFDQAEIKKFSTQNIAARNARNNATLGFMPIDGRILKAYQAGHKPEPFTPTGNYIEVTIAIAQMLVSAALYQAYQERKRTVFIDDKGISTLEFSLTEADKKALMKSGYDATMSFLS